MRLSSRKAQKKGTLELSMTSMIDVVFLLLIFFMVTASFVKTEKEIQSAIEVQEASPNTEQREYEPAIVEIVAADTGGFVYRLGGREITSENELTKVLSLLPNKADGAFVRPSGNAPFAMTAAAIAACKEARFFGVSYVPMEE